MKSGFSWKIRITFGMYLRMMRRWNRYKPRPTRARSPATTPRPIQTKVTIYSQLPLAAWRSLRAGRRAIPPAANAKPPADSEAAYHQRDVLAAEAEAVAQHMIDAFLACLVG